MAKTEEVIPSETSKSNEIDQKDEIEGNDKLQKEGLETKDETTKRDEKWIKARDQAAKYLVDDQGNMKRGQIDTWAAVDDLGLTPHEFRLLHCIARHENWKSIAGTQKKELKNGCYASAQKLSEITGISRNKIFEILKILQQANIIENINHRGKKGKGGVSLAGWTNEFKIKSIKEWALPSNIETIRSSLKEKKKISKASSKDK